jgi:D-alanyl-D-alanine carboxypeptidase (penicillin-binding protein 5/6)
MVLIVLAGCTLFLIGGVLFVRTHTPGITSTKPIDPKAYTNVSVIGKAAIVYDLTDGKTLYEKNAESSLPLASVTKLLTVYAASRVLRPDSVVTITPLALAQRGDEADGIFYKGESFRFDEITRLTLAASSNIGAEAIAEAADAEAHTDTATLLAEAAKEIGLAHTRALNATGLDKSASVSGSYGSAHDVAVLAGELLKKNPQAAPATTQPDVTITSREGVHHRFDNTNADVTTYPNLLLSKTGYTDLAGGNLVIVVDVGTHHPVAIVVLGSTVDGRFTDVSKLLTATHSYFSGAH